MRAKKDKVDKQISIGVIVKGLNKVHLIFCINFRGTYIHEVDNPPQLDIQKVKQKVNKLKVQHAIQRLNVFWTLGLPDRSLVIILVSPSICQ